jgi:hypothetical protein
MPNPTVKFALRAGTALKRSPLPPRSTDIGRGAGGVFKLAVSQAARLYKRGGFMIACEASFALPHRTAA